VLGKVWRYQRDNPHLKLKKYRQYIVKRKKAKWSTKHNTEKWRWSNMKPTKQDEGMNSGTPEG
jgi:hypothetical protein